MRRVGALLMVLAVAACGGDEPAVSASPIGEEVPPTTVDQVPPTTAPVGCAHVVGATAEAAADGTYAFRVTVRSADTGPEKYADAWEVRAPDGTILGTRVLSHDHVNEQPFTRSLSGVAIPAGVTEVVVAARDSVVGFCGDTFTLALS